jgi:hypothetical protein
MTNKLKTTIILSLAFYTIIFCGCNKQTRTNEVKQKNEQEMNENDSCLIINDISFEGKEDFLKFIEKRRETFYAAGRNISFWELYTYKSISFVFPIFSYWLKGKGYKPCSDDTFNDKLKNIFQIDLSKKSECVYLEKNYIEYYTYQAYETEGDIITEGSFLFSPQYKLFFRPSFNGNIVEEIEKTQQYETCFPEKLYHYNKYLFNDDKASLTWLIHNDIEFLELLVKEFGYDKDPKVNKAILKKANKQYNSTQPQDEDAFIRLFASRDCDGKLQIREGLLKTVADETNANQNDLFKFLDEYCFRLAFPREEEAFSFEERCKILACINNITYPVFIKYKCSEEVEDVYWDDHSQLYVICYQKPEIIEEIEKNNYFGFSDLRNYIKEEVEMVEDNKHAQQSQPDE